MTYRHWPLWGGTVVALLAACGETSKFGGGGTAEATTSTASGGTSGGTAGSGGAGGEAPENPSTGGTFEAPVLVEPCAAPREEGFAVLTTMNQAPTVVIGDAEYVYFGLADTVYRSSLAGGCAEALFRGSGSISDLKVVEGRLYALVTGTGERNIFAFSADGVGRAELVVHIDGRALVDIREFAVLDRQLYLVQTLELTRFDLDTKASTPIEVPLPGGPEKLTSVDGRVYWSQGGRVWSGDVDPWIGYGVARMSNDDSEAEVYSTTSCMDISAGPQGVWCITAPSINEANMITGSYGEVVKLAADGEASAPIAEDAYALAAGNEYVFVAWADSVAAYEQTRGDFIYQASIERPYRFASNGELAILVTLDESGSWVLATWDPE